MWAMWRRWTDAETVRVVYIGLCFTVLFSSDFTVINMQKTLTASIKEDKPEYNIDGYVNLGLTYAVYALALWLAPSVLALLGPKTALILGSLGYIVLIVSLTVEVVWVTYLGLVLAGIGGSILWVAEGNYMVLISGRNNMSRNVAIFWVLFSASLIFGNLYATVELEGKDRIDGRTRHQLLYVLTGVCAVATLMLVLLPASPRNSRDNKFAQTPDPHLGPLEALATTWNILWKKEILLLMITFIYAGFQQSFGQGIFGSCIGFTRQFGVQAKQLVPLSGLVYGVGDLVGGIGQAALNTVKSKIKCWSVVMVCLGYCCQAAAYIIVYLTIPNNAVFGESTELSVYPSRVWLALLASALLGLGDSCLNTQIFPLLAALQPNYSSQTCALYKFMKSMAMAACFFASPFLGLHTQLAIIFAFGILSSAAFISVDLKRRPQPTIDGKP